MLRPSPAIKKFLLDETAATSIEYALIASIVSIAIVTALTNTQTALRQLFNSVSNGFNTALN